MDLQELPYTANTKALTAFTTQGALTEKTASVLIIIAT